MDYYRGVEVQVQFEFLWILNMQWQQFMVSFIQEVIEGYGLVGGVLI